jgi:hypothetical protein
LKLKLIQKRKFTNKVIAFWKCDLNFFQHQHFLSLQLYPKFNSQYQGDITLSLLIADNSKNLNISKLNKNSSRTRINDSVNADLQKDIIFPANSFLQHQAISSQTHSSFDSFENNLQEKNLCKSILIRNSICISILNKLKQKIAFILEKFIDDDLEHIISFPVISKKLFTKITKDINNFEPIFFVFRWSDMMSSLDQKENSRKIYALVATIHLILILQQKQLLSKDDLKIIIDSFTKLYQEVLNSILENAKSHFENEDNMNIFCLNLLDQLNQIGHGELCNSIYSSLLLDFVLSAPDEFSDHLCQHLCVSKIEKDIMKKENIDSISFLFKKYDLN